MEARVPDKLDLRDILKTKMVSNDKYVRKLEAELQKIHKVKHAVCFANATTGFNLIFYILQPLTVAMPCFTWISTKIGLDMQKINIKYMDITNGTWVVNEQEQKRFYGADYMILNSTFGNKPIVVYPKWTIIDSAHCAGHSGFGNLGLAEIISFSPSKTFTGIEGGAVLTNDNKLATELRYYQPIMGRMGEINAKVALNNLRCRDTTFKWKQKVYNLYKQELQGSHIFQEINDYHALNEIGMLCPLWTKKQWKLIDKRLEVRKRFDPNFRYHLCMCYSKYIYNNILILPSYPGCDYKKVIKVIQDVDWTV